MKSFPVVRGCWPTATVTIAGRKPHPRLAERANRPGVQILANPEDTRSLFAGRILVVPLSMGGGSLLKILEAFASGTPVISSPKGVEGLEVQPGTHYLPAGAGPQSYAEQIHELLVNAREDLERRIAAFGLVRSAYSWASIREPVKTAVRKLTARAL
jgi:glycosyltransferase involved in cell wall biosynthesis